MNTAKTLLAAAVTGVLALSACAPGTTWESACVETATGVYFNEDDQCDPNDDDFTGRGAWYFFKNGSYKPGHKASGGSFTRPAGVDVQSVYGEDGGSSTHRRRSSSSHSEPKRLGGVKKAAKTTSRSSKR